MFVGENLLFVEKNRINGVSPKNGKEYDFTNLLVSDGFQTIELNASNELLASPVLDDLKKGQKIKLTVDHKRGRFVATQIQKI